jgi:hypothetical protein
VGLTWLTSCGTIKQRPDVDLSLDDSNAFYIPQKCIVHTPNRIYEINEQQSEIQSPERQHEYRKYNPPLRFGDDQVACIFEHGIIVFGSTVDSVRS